jgi:hypothetical protein
MLYEPIVGILGAVVGYGMQAFNMNPVIGNRIAVASMVPATKGIYDWARQAMTGAGTATRARRVSTTTTKAAAIATDPLTRYKQGGL